MNSGFYAACAGLVARTQALDTIASNVANSSSAGYRGQTNSFGTVLATAAGHHGTMSPLNRATNSYGVLSGTHLDTTQGTMTHTGNTLDLAIQGGGYFKVQTAKGAVYTRNGNFGLTAQGQLVTGSGDAVMGEDGPITLTEGSQLTFSADGTISSDGAIAGKLKVVEFAPGTELANHGNSYYAAAEKSEVAATGSAVQQGSLEGSNVSPIDGVVQLISAQRSAESMRHILTMLDTEMNKTAAQDLPRVS